MDLAFYAAAAGAMAQKRRMNVVANNLANVQTTGFKSEDTIFSNLVYNELDRPAQEGTQLTSSSGARVNKTNTDFTQGHLAPSEMPYDYALSGEGFFGLLNPQTGQITYTRDGSFRLSLQTDGRFLLTAEDGKLVVDKELQPIEVNEENKESLLPVGVFRFSNINGMTHIGNNEFTPVGKNGEAVAMENTDSVLVQKCLENSNVYVGDEFAKMIEAERAYQYSIKMIITSDEIETTINNLRQG